MIFLCSANSSQPLSTTIREDYLKKIKILAIEKDKRVNDMLEEAIEWLMVKYARQSPEN
jgi:hypothetical protein